MKISKVFLGLCSLFLLSGCDSVDKALAEFEDDNVKSIVKVSKSKKDEVRSSVRNYAAGLYLDLSGNVQYQGGSSYSVDVFDDSALAELDYFSFEDELLRFACLGYEGRIKKENDQYISSGTYFDFVNGFFGEDFFPVGPLYEGYAGDTIFSFGLIDRLKIVVDNFNSPAFATEEINITLENEKWYNSVECYDYIDEGTFKIRITEPIVFYMESLRCSYNAIELEYNNYLLSRYFMNCTEKQESQSTIINVSISQLVMFSYNIADADALFAERTPKA